MILHALERGGAFASGPPPLVLLHGLFGQAANFGTAQRRLAEEQPAGNRRVIALDLRNHGVSPHASAMDYPAMAEDVLETLRELRALPAVLVGHSMGGKVAMAAALEAPAAVARLLVADIAPVAYDHGHSHARLLAAMAALPLTPALTRAQADAALAAGVPDAATRGFLLQNLQLGAGPLWRLNLAGIAAALPQLVGWPDMQGACYRGPTLFLSGARSDYVLPEHRPLIRALFPAARFVVLKDAGHWIHSDDPEGFIGVVARFAG